ncbi:hypothetical protein [Pontimicrobium sp. IMCC45349]|uniref:hypothetical protein n=1 Tax=Pontimicrobium sp. IMCC45349 TaxID=3391574 RepID=UPI0039A0870F
MDTIEFIDSLQRDKARGYLAPHQIILLMSLHKVYSKNRSIVIRISDLLETFKKVWENNQYLFKSKNCNLGLPLKAFVNKGFIEITITEEINDYRNKNELTTKISELKLSHLILNIINKKDSYEYFKSRINK